MPDILVRDVPERTLEALKARAKRAGRQLEEELLAALQRLAQDEWEHPVDRIRRIRARLAQRQQCWSDSTPLIRKDRDR